MSIGGEGASGGDVKALVDDLLANPPADSIELRFRIDGADLKALRDELIERAAHPDVFDFGLILLMLRDSAGEPLKVRRARGAVAVHRVPMPAPTRVKKDVVSLLLEDRQRRR